MTKKGSQKFWKANWKKFWWTTKKGRQKFRETNRKYSRSSKNLVGPGHPTASARHCVCH